MGVTFWSSVNVAGGAQQRGAQSFGATGFATVHRKHIGGAYREQARRAHDAATRDEVAAGGGCDNFQGCIDSGVDEPLGQQCCCCYHRCKIRSSEYSRCLELLGAKAERILHRDFQLDMAGFNLQKRKFERLCHRHVEYGTAHVFRGS